MTYTNTIYSTATKFDSLMVPLWSKGLIGKYGKRIISFSDGSHLFTSGTIMEKIDNEGNSVWNKKINNTANSSFYCYNSTNHNDTIYSFGRFSFNPSGGPSVSRAGFITLDSACNFLSADTLSISNNSSATIDEIILNDQGEKMFFGLLNNTNGKLFFVKLDPQNNVLISKQYLNSSFYSTFIKKAIQLSNGDFLIAGSMDPNSISSGVTRTGFVSRISANGDVVWNKIVNENVLVSGIQELSNGNILVTDANHAVYGQIENYYLELDFDGNIIWSKKQDSDAVYISEALELSNNQRCFLKFDEVPVVFDTDSLGNEMCPVTSSPITLSDFTWLVENQPSQLNSVAPLTISPINGLLKHQQEYLETCTYYLVEQEEITHNMDVTIFPNPSSSNFMIVTGEPNFSVEIYSIQGELIESFISHELNTEISIPIKGIYLVKVSGSKGVSVQKVIIE